MNELFTRLRSGIPRPKSDQEAIAAALQVIRRLESEAGSEESVAAAMDAEEKSGHACHACGSQNPRENRFCLNCGVPLQTGPTAEAAAKSGAGYPAGQHHYHHHYHHHYVTAADGITQPGSQDPRAASLGRGRVPLGGPALSRAEAAVRQLTQDWAQACNTRHLDDLVELYTADALVLRPNFPAVRGTAAIREFFFAALENGLGEVELEAQRVELLGEVAYEAGRCKMLVPVAMGKRREERGKYLIVLHRQAGGEWKAVADCWSSDLTLAVGTEPGAAKTGPQDSGSPLLRPPRKSA